MKELLFFGLGFISGMVCLAILIMIIDNREWVRNLYKKHRIGKFAETDDEHLARLEEERGIYREFYKH